MRPPRFFAGRVAVGLACALLAGCTVEGETRVEGVGVDVKRMEVLPASPQEITIEDGLRLRLVPPSGTEGPLVEFEGCENLLRHVRVEAHEGRLRLYVERGFSLHPAPSVRVVASGVTALRCVGAGAGEVLDYRGESLVLDLTGSESLRATGRVGTLELNAVGSAVLDLSALVASRVRVEAIGNALIRVHAEELAEVSTIGSGVVTVSGGAEIERSVVGSGGVERAER